MIEEEIFNMYLEIKQDLVSNLDIVFMRSHTYTHKYVGNYVTDINVAIEEKGEGMKLIQIFVRHKGKWIKDVLMFNSTGVITDKITSNFL